MVILFLIGYLLIAIEQPIRINKSAVALLTGMVLWVIYALQQNGETNSQLMGSLGEASGVLFFLVGAMMIVEFIDEHGGFQIITSRIHLTDKRKLLWVISLITFFLSSVLDNMTTTIVIVMLLRKLIEEQKTRWLFIGTVVIAANAGGAWTPIGDITSILLWVHGNLEALPMMTNLFLPSIISLLIPVSILTFTLKGDVTQSVTATNSESEFALSKPIRWAILIFGVLGIVSVPLFNELTGLPPFVCILMVLALLWIISELFYNHSIEIAESKKQRMAGVLYRIDFATVLFLLGILLSVGALQHAGVLSTLAAYLDTNVHSVYWINVLIGLVSSIVDNSSLVAGAIGMYPILSESAVQASTDPIYMANYLQNGDFWQLLNFCAGTGGSMLIVGSAAGVVAMGLDKISFIWYMKRISPAALLGFASGVATFYLLS